MQDGKESNVMPDGYQKKFNAACRAVRSAVPHLVQQMPVEVIKQLAQAQEHVEKARAEYSQAVHESRLVISRVLYGAR